MRIDILYQKHGQYAIEQDEDEYVLGGLDLFGIFQKIITDDRKEKAPNCGEYNRVKKMRVVIQPYKNIADYDTDHDQERQRDTSVYEPAEDIDAQKEMGDKYKRDTQQPQQAILREAEDIVYLKGNHRVHDQRPEEPEDTARCHKLQEDQKQLLRYAHRWSEYREGEAVVHPVVKRCQPEYHQAADDQVPQRAGK
jgi:hypothetical protein